MDNFMEKWKTDKKFRAKIKLLLYGLFLVSVIIYVTTLDNKQLPIEDEITDIVEGKKDTITIPTKYKYITEVEIDNDKYTYSGEKNDEQLTISKTNNDKTTDYIFKDNEYYIKDNDLYVKTTKDEVYDVVNYNYINLESINSYLEKAKSSNNNQYLVYLKDIILGNDSEEYFTILINDDKINIDYTPLIKQFNHDIKKYKVNIQINEIE